MTKKIIYAGILLISFLLAGCEDFLNKGPLTTLSEDTYWQTGSDAAYAVNGMYECFYELDGGGYWSPGGAPYLDILTGLAYCRNSWEFGFMNFINGSMTADNAWNLSWWKKKYRFINYANYFFKNVERVKDQLSESEYNDLCGQARVVRAFCYLRLVQAYGDVPFTTNTISPDQWIGRTSADTIMQFVISEFDKAAQELPSTQSDDAHGRIFKYVAYAYEARAAMHYAGKYGKTEYYQQAADALDALVTSGQFELYQKNSDLATNFNEMFWTANEGADNKEIIFSDQFIKDKRPNNISTCLAGTGWKALQGTQQLIDLFETIEGWQASGINFADMNKYRNTMSLKSPLEGKSPLFDPRNESANRDPRMAATFFMPTLTLSSSGTFTKTGEFWAPANSTFKPDRDNDCFLFKKMVDPTNFNPVYYFGNSENNFPLIRYSDMLLLFAEVLNELGTTSSEGQDALYYVNMVRNRVGMPPVLSTDKDEIREIIKHERKVELILENVLVWDYMRWNDLEKAFPYGQSVYGFRRETYGKKSVEFYKIQRTYPKYNLWPIPTVELRNNPNSSMDQNEGW